MADKYNGMDVMSTGKRHRYFMMDKEFLCILHRAYRRSFSAELLNSLTLHLSILPKTVLESIIMMYLTPLDRYYLKLEILLAYSGCFAKSFYAPNSDTKMDWRTSMVSLCGKYLGTSEIYPGSADCPFLSTANFLPFPLSESGRCNICENAACTSCVCGLCFTTQRLLTMKGTDVKYI